MMKTTRITKKTLPKTTIPGFTSRCRWGHGGLALVDLEPAGTRPLLRAGDVNPHRATGCVCSGGEGEPESFEQLALAAGRGRTLSAAEPLPEERAVWIAAYVEARRASEPERDDYYFEAGSRGWLEGDELAKANAHLDRRQRQHAELVRWFEAWKKDDPKSLRAFCARRAEVSRDRAEHWREIRAERCFGGDVFHAFEELVAERES